tara:strand:+ start:6867 stop:7460 length:594 start_codon:yes stop_codon:yes gene_type:complete
MTSNSSNDTDIQDILQRLQEKGQDEEKVTIGGMIEATGSRSFGPLLLLAGLVAISPLSGIPGIPTTVGIIVILSAGQLLIGRDHFWLPDWILRKKISGSKIEKGMKMLMKPAGVVDRVMRPRLQFLTKGLGAWFVALFCVCVAMTMPPLEPLPFLASTAGIVLTLMGLALTTNDGLVALIAIVVAPLIGFGVYSLLT